MTHESVDVQVIIQARMSSTRLPGKILAPFIGDYTVLEWIIERARSSNLVNRVVVATTTNPKDDETIAACIRSTCEYARGSEGDVLGRFEQVVNEFPCKTIVHITADNPFFDLDEMNRLTETLIENGLDYANNHPAGLPLGTGTEAFNSEAFLKMAKMTDDPYDHEHVTPYFYNHTELFKQTNLAPLELHTFAPNVRLTLDTPQDLQFLKELTTRLNIVSSDKHPSTVGILSFLQEHPEIVEINKGIVQKTFPVKKS